MEATFQNCDGLTSVKLPASLRSLRQAFSDCPNLESAELQEGIEVLDQALSMCEKLKSVNLPSTVTSMNGTFQECVSLTEACLPENVTSSNRAYLNCNSVGKITIRNKIIGDFAFCNCNKTNELEIPDGVVSIGNSAFYGVPGPKKLTIPGSVTHIGATALNQNVEEITFEYGEEPLEYNERSWSSDWNLQKLKHLILNRNIVLTSYSPFSNPSKLTQVEFGDRVTSIPNGLFAGCTGITRLNLPAQMESIGSEAFAGCTGITWLTLPAQMQSIGSKAFSGCTGIKGITSYTEDPYPIEDDTFDQNAYDFTPIYVPQGTVDRYRLRRGWKNFYYINEIGPDGVKGIEASDPKTKTPILYDLQGRRLQQKPTKGIYIQNGKKVLSK